MKAYKKQFIEFMIESDVLKFGDFKTKSGRKTPFFINTGNYKTGSQIKKLGEFYAEAITENFANNFDFIFGPAYKGIPLAVTISITLASNYNIDKPFCFNRKETKDHGEGGSLVGYKPQNGDKVLIVEDVTTAGTSIRESVPMLKSLANVNSEALIISVDRMEKGTTNRSALSELREEFGLKTASIVNLDEIVEYLYNVEVNGVVHITDKIKERISEYRKLYGASEK